MSKNTNSYNTRQWAFMCELLSNHKMYYYVDHLTIWNSTYGMKGFQTFGRQRKYPVLYLACHNVGGYILQCMKYPLKLMEVTVFVEQSSV